ncbi:gliding motility-associated C-terminal domain-containing protein [Parapedobacter koreensis]|uniref:Gliding motility-associated C-terminal domain-containing protein n=1 Tax=Parapedobacter koreensis TaxID=332977 RepID=A0A1H7TWL5_9SPHI|nr:gliding motility-associated C-terminal domain-containing protein [Parapedobacter koreensis]SEL88858.1 gliding motility-associated C-terminal domain-containing protein [Parapedobacter koreensis]
MNHLSRISTVALLLLLSLGLHAEVFVVTSNADSGPGTLREALQKATDNGGSETDEIHFNLPGSGASAKTIRLRTRLPNITGNLIIDGSTQPGETLSINGAKVILVANMPDMEEETGYAYDKVALSLSGNFQLFELYGMIIKAFSTRSPEGYFDSGSAIHVNAQLQTLRLGARGKGNVLYNNARTILVGPEYGSHASIHTAQLKNNHIGVDEQGHFIDQHLQSTVDLIYTSNLTVGGSEDEGNIILATFLHSPTGDIDDVMSSDCAVTISNNRFGMDANGDNPYDFLYKLNTYFATGATRHPTGARATITMVNNEWGCSVGINGYNNATVTIQRNTFGATKDRTKMVPIYLHAIMVSYVSGRTLIGGESTVDGNLFTNILHHDYSGYKAVVYAQEAHNVELSHNSMYCNTVVPFIVENPLSEWQLIQDVDLTLDDVTESYASGTATKPGSRIELFYTDKDCESCQPKTYFATATANAQGKWRYDGLIDPDKNVIAAATYGRQSSEFTHPQIFLWIGKLEVEHLACDTELGSIKGAFVKHANKFQWLDEKGEVVGNTLDIEGLDAGTYYLTVNQFGCKVIDSVIIENTIPWIDVESAQYIHPNCDRGGEITWFNSNHVSELYWTDESGNPATDQAYFPKDLLPGRYWAHVKNYYGCEKTFGPFELIDQGGTPIVIDDTQLVVQAASCGSPSSGSITGLQITGATEFAWRNESGELIDTAQELHHVPAGGYRLYLSNGPCASETIYYYVDEEPPTDYPAYAVQIAAAYCGQPNGTIRIDLGSGVRPASLRWLNGNGREIGTTAQLDGLAPDIYTLLLTDAQGCEVQYGTYTVDNTPDLTLIATSVTVVNDACGHGTGSISGLQPMAGRAPYRYAWADERGTAVGQLAEATGLTAGRYRLTVTDANGCQVESAMYSILNDDGQLAPPTAPEVLALCSPGKVSISYTGSPDYHYRLYPALQGGVMIEENTGITPFEVYPTQTTTYYLAAADGSCESPRVPIRVEISNAGIQAPNTFSPNGDGHNDTWHIAGLASYPHATVHIFNRNGQLLYTQRTGAPDFDGRYRGSDLPVGAYFYIIDLGMGCDPLKGSINLLR